MSFSARPIIGACPATSAPWRFCKTAPAPVSRIQHDWSFQIQRELGKIELGLALSGGGPEREYFDGSSHTKTAITATARWAF